MKPFPRDPLPESTLAVGADPYRYISRRCTELKTDVFQMRFLLQNTICLRGRDGGELFYDTTKFQRRGATPGRIQKTLLGTGGVQGLDDKVHQHRKQMLLSVMTPDRIGGLIELAETHWKQAIPRWSQREEIVLYSEVQEILCRAVCAWAGVPLPEDEVHHRTRQLTRLFDYAGRIGPKYWMSRWSRHRANRWIGKFIQQVRRRKLRLPETSAAHTIAWHRDLKGQLLSPHVAAVELLNVLRPTVAVSVFIVFAAHALSRHPECAERIQERDEDFLANFALEVRRFYPFFPFVNGLVRQDFDWRGYHFPKGTRVLFDLYGTNHDPNSWEEPETFQPDRFREWNGDPFNYVPQGGGDHATNHRCPGEWIAIELIKLAARLFATEMEYEVPEQDLQLDMTRLPALPKSQFRIHHVRASSASAIAADDGDADSSSSRQPQARNPT